MKGTRKISDSLTIILSIFFVLISFVIYHYIFKYQLNAFSMEITTAIFGTVIIVASMVVMMKIQSREDKEKEYSSKIFEKKLEIYRELLNDIFTMDDDNLIEPQEIQNIENKIGVASLVAGEKLVAFFSQFIYQLKAYGVIYHRSMVSMQIQHFKLFVMNNQNGIKKTSMLAKYQGKNNNDYMHYFVSLDDLVQAIRDDLSVVKGDILNRLEFFVQMKYDEFKLVKNPNIVD